MADDMLALFPKDSWTPKSRTSKNVWNKDGSLSAGFMAQAENMKEESMKMAQVAKTGDVKAIKKQLRNLAANGCRGCHTLYRTE